MDPAHIIDEARASGKAWSQHAPRVRRHALLRFASVLAQRHTDLVSAIVQDTGKPALDALGGDVLVTLEHMRYYHRHAHRLLAPRRIQRDWLLFHGTQFTQTLEPHGVVLIYGASNYPLQLAMVPAVTALYAGNAVVLKLSEHTPALARVLQEIVLEAKLPENLLQIVCDEAATAGNYIDARPDFICFTGSCANGAEVATRAAALLIPTLLELGGKDAAIVFRDCNLERTVEGIVYGAFVNSGQVCVGIKRLYVERIFYAEFLRRLTERVATLSINTPNGAPGDITPVSSRPLLQRLQTQIVDAIAQGAEVVSESADLSGATPLVLASVAERSLLLQEESFGPVLCVAPFDTEDEAIQLANNTRFALGASIWTNDSDKGRRVAVQMHAANVSINDVIRNIANPAAEFGGNKSSGYGRYHGPAGLFTFSRTRTVMAGSSSSSRPRHWFPFTTAKYDALRKLIEFRHVTLARLSRFFCVAFLMLGIASTLAQGNCASWDMRVVLTSRSDQTFSENQVIPR